MPLHSGCLSPLSLGPACVHAGLSRCALRILWADLRYSCHTLNDDNTTWESTGDICRPHCTWDENTVELVGDCLSLGLQLDTCDQMVEHLGCLAAHVGVVIAQPQEDSRHMGSPLRRLEVAEDMKGRHAHIGVVIAHRGRL